MNIETGDIWEYHHEMYGHSVVLVIEKRINTMFSNNPVFYWCFNLLENRYGEYVFNETNKVNWTRLA